MTYRPQRQGERRCSRRGVFGLMRGKGKSRTRVFGSEGAHRGGHRGVYGERPERERHTDSTREISRAENDEGEIGTDGTTGIQETGRDTKHGRVESERGTERKDLARQQTGRTVGGTSEGQVVLEGNGSSTGAGGTGKHKCARVREGTEGIPGSSPGKGGGGHNDGQVGSKGGKTGGDQAQAPTGGDAGVDSEVPCRGVRHERGYPEGLRPMPDIGVQKVGTGGTTGDAGSARSGNDGTRRMSRHGRRRQWWQKSGRSWRRC